MEVDLADERRGRSGGERGSNVTCTNMTISQDYPQY